MERVSPSLAEPVVIDNRPGAAGNIALDAVAKSAPDGYTLASADPFSTMPANATMFADLVHQVRDLTPIANFGVTDVALIVNKDLPAKDIHEFVALAKSKPGELLYGSTGNGSPGHLNGALLSRQLGIKTVHVPYRNGAQGARTCWRDGSFFRVAPIPTRLEQVRQGMLRVLAVGRKQRTADLPDVPTVGETGYGDFEGSTAYALFAPKGTPGLIIDKLYGEVRKAMESKKIGPQATGRAGMEPQVMPPAEVTKLLETQIAKWADIIKSADIRMDNAAR